MKGIIRNAKLKKIEPTTTYVKQEFKKVEEVIKEENKIHDFFEIYDEFRDGIKINKSKGTLKKFNNLYKNLVEFEKKRKSKITFESIDQLFLDDWMKFLFQRKYADSTIKGRVMKFKQFMTWAKERNYHNRNEYRKLSHSEGEKDIIYLTQAELKQLTEFDLSSYDTKNYDISRDMFCFSCCTGLRYSDVKTLRPEHIKKDVIVKRIVKTQRINTIPITPQAQRILDKYPVEKEDTYRFNVPNDVVLNRYIKEIGEIVGINTLITITKSEGGKPYEVTKPKHDFITFHVGRHTFIILSLEKGIRVETVQKAVGHRDIKTTMRYVKILDSVVKNEFLEGWKED